MIQFCCIHQAAAAEAVTERQMFGGLAFVLGGHMFCGIVKDALMVRLGPGAAIARWAGRTCCRWTSPDGP